MQKVKFKFNAQVQIQIGRSFFKFYLIVFDLLEFEFDL